MSCKKTNHRYSAAAGAPTLLHPQRLMYMHESLIKHRGTIEGGRTAITILQAYCDLYDANRCRQHMYNLVSSARPETVNNLTATETQQMFVFHEFTILLLDASREILRGLQNAVEQEQQRRE